LSEPEEGLFLIPVSLIKQYHFCPRIVYFTEVLGFKERRTESMERGHEEHERLAELDIRRKTLFGHRRIRILKRWTRLHVASERLGLVGTIDLVVLTEEGLAVVEYKRSSPPKRPPPGHIYQAAAYAMLAEEYFGAPVRRFYIYYDDGRSSRAFKLTLTRARRDHVLWTAKKIRAIIEDEELPRPVDKRRCSGCGYYRLCKGV